MSVQDRKLNKDCKEDALRLPLFRQQLTDIAEKIISDCYNEHCYTHIDYDPIPSNESVIEIINKFKEILFPGYFTSDKLDSANLKYSMGQAVSILFDILSEQIASSIRHNCLRYGEPCTDCRERGYKIALDVLDTIPLLRKVLATDVKATFDGDPAAKSHDEIISSYPGLFAMMVYRVANLLYKSDVPLLPRIMTEYAHSKTGIDIHPGADIKGRFVIDHGTGVVIGETTEIGENVRIYQGVTLGAHSLPKNAGNSFRGKKRHPTIASGVIIYSGATILGGDTVIGKRSVIGGNVWVTRSVPADSKVIIEEPKLIFK